MPVTLVLFVLTLSLMGTSQVQTAQPTSVMKADVARLVTRAATLKSLWPWQAPIPEVSRVARHGKRVAPLLLELLADDPDDVPSDQYDWRVQQQAALALCRIFGVSEECSHAIGRRGKRTRE
jgi:hypothetical protein